MFLLPLARNLPFARQGARGKALSPQGHTTGEPLPLSSRISERFCVHGQSLPHRGLGHLIRNVDLGRISPARNIPHDIP